MFCNILRSLCLNQFHHLSVCCFYVEEWVKAFSPEKKSDDIKSCLNDLSKIQWNNYVRKTYWVRQFENQFLGTLVNMMLKQIMKTCQKKGKSTKAASSMWFQVTGLKDLCLLFFFLYKKILCVLYSSNPNLLVCFRVAGFFLTGLSFQHRLCFKPI